MTGEDVRWLLGLAMLLGAIPGDLIRRRIPNTWWIPFTAIAGILGGGDIASQRTGVVVPLALAAGAAGLGYAFWRLRAMGGADAKAIMVLAFLVPYPSSPWSLQPALDALANGSILVLLVPLAGLAINVAKRDFSAGMLIGVRMPIAKARTRHVWPMQVVRNGEVHWRLGQKAVLDDHAGTYDDLERLGLDHVWVTMRIPFIVPLAAGLALAWAVGNVPLRLLIEAT
jgi:preflagellin peptidase FlaK